MKNSKDPTEVNNNNEFSIILYNNLINYRQTMDPTHSDFHLLCLFVRHHTFNCVEHREGWVQEKGSADFTGESFCVLRPPHLLLPFFAAFKALQ